MPTVARLGLQVDLDGDAEAAARLEALDRILRSRAAAWSDLSRRFVIDADDEGAAMGRLENRTRSSTEGMARSWDRPRDAMGRFRRESDTVHEEVTRNVDRDTDSHRRFGGMLGVVGQQMTRMAARGAILTNALIPLAVAGFQVGSALAPIVGVAGAIPALLVAGGVAAGTAALAFHGMGDALTAMAKAQDGSKASAQALQRAMDALPPAARPVVRQLFEMRGMVTQLRQTAAAGIMPGVAAGLRAVGGLFPIVRREIGQTADVIGRLISGFAALARTGPFRRDFQTLIGTSSRLTANFGRAAISLARAFMDVAVAGQPLAVQFGGLVEQGARWVQRATAGARASGSLARFMQAAGDTAETLFNIIADVVVVIVNLGRAAAPSGAGLLQMLSNLTSRAAYFSQNIERLRGALRQVGDAFVIVRTAMLGVAFGPWGLAAGALVGVLIVLYRRSESFRNAVNMIGQTISRVAVPAFRSLVGWVSGTLLPAIERTIPFVREQFAGAFQELSRALGQNRGQFQQVGSIIVRVAGWILVNLVPAAIRLGAIMGSQLVRNVAMAIRIFGTVVNAIRAIVGVIAAVIGAIGRFIDFTVRSWNSLVAVTRAAFARVQDIFGTVTSTITRAWNAAVAITQATFARVAAIVNTVATVISRAWNTTLGITRAVWGFIQANVIGNIRRVVVEVVRAIGGLIPERIRQGWNASWRTTGQFWTAIRRFLSDTLTSMGGNVLRMIGGLIPRQVRDGWNTAWRTTSQFWATIRRFLSDTLNSMGGNVFRSIGQLIPRQIRDGWNSAWRSTREAWNGIRNTVADGTRRAWNIISGWGRDVRGFFGRMIGDATGWGRRIWANIRTGIGQIDLRRFIRDALNRGINTINSFARGVASFGNRILPGSPLQWTNIPTLRQMGGLIPGAPRGDRVPVLAEGGEVMIRQPVAEPLRDALLALNRLPASSARALARELRGSRTVDIAGDVARMVVSRNSLSRPDRQGISVAVPRQEGGLVPVVIRGWDGAAMPDGWQRLQAGGITTGSPGSLIQRTQSWIRAQDPKPYVFGGVGPGGYDCSGITGDVFALLTGRANYRRYFSTQSDFTSVGFRPGTGAYTIGVDRARGHMAGNLQGLPFEARSRATGIFVGPSARSVLTFPQRYFLPQISGRFLAGGAGGGIDFVGLIQRALNAALRPARAGLDALAGNSLVGGLARGVGNQFIDALAKRVMSLATFAMGPGTTADPALAAQGNLSAAERWIISHESGFRTTADNPTSTAFGLGQLLLANRQRYGAILGVSPNTTDYNSQLQMFRMYVRDRYGTAEAAQRFWQSHGWYQHGLDTIVRRPTLIGVGEAGPEHVRVTPGSTAPGGREGTTIIIQRDGIHVELSGTYAEPITMADVHGAVGSAIHELRVMQVKGERIRWPGSGR